MYTYDDYVIALDKLPKSEDVVDNMEKDILTLTDHGKTAIAMKLEHALPAAVFGT